MLKIGYNKSDKHIGSKSHLERPDRINYCIMKLQNDLLNSTFIENINYEKSTLFNMILEVHSKEYFTKLIEYVPREYICRECGEKQKSHGLHITMYIEAVKVCKTCKDKNNLEDTIYCHLDRDTYYTAHTLNIILDGIGVLRQLIDTFQFGTKYTFALIRPPGHHCENNGSGFCILNNALIATKYAQSVGYQKAFILDIDFHHGDGTQKLLNTNKNLTDIRFCSIHGYGSGVYPGTGSRSENTSNILNIPLKIDIFDDRTRSVINDDYYLNIISGEVNEFILKDMPNIIIVSCGFDGHQNDSLQGLNLSDNAYSRIVSHLKTYNVPVLYILEGGYNKNAIYNSIFGMLNEMAK